MGTPRFAFLVHPLTAGHRRVLGLRIGAPGLLFGQRDGADPFDVRRVARLGIPGIVEGVVISTALTPDELLADQERALTRLLRAAALARADGPLAAIGLGALNAVVAGRGTALAERVPEPVTTGGAATAWALVENTLAVCAARQTAGPVAIIGSRSPVGAAVAALLVEAGLAVRVDHSKAGRGLAVEPCAGPADAAAGAPVVVGAGPTGGTLDPAALAPGTVVVDVAIPATLTGPPPAGVQVLAGEAVVPPIGFGGDRWRLLYQVLAGYGPGQVYACLVEPLVLAVEGRARPYALGRAVEPAAVREFGRAAERLGFRPRLARGWRGVPPGALGGR